ncbi:Beta-galactosidase [Pseudobythopirellula maris]|uniref:Beta-galactosidase n=2 Tax=Pseudobythopirellula maris TaxID=2527991 RepID=A0A5C5ZRW4_9BACT|nr:Beta-galactosidase [Pseudobythopirellula maris]
MAAATLGVMAAASAEARTRGFDHGWRFSSGDPEGAEQIDFDDLAWSSVTTPHDWAIAGPFNPEENGYAGKLPWRGVGWYRKWFSLDAAKKGSRVYLDFDGVMAFAKVYINGQLAFEGDYGYASFRVDATPYLRFGRSNVVAVRADTTRLKTRWYPGAGIYRKVSLVVSPPVHLARHGARITTSHVSDSAARVVISNEIECHAGLSDPFEVEVEILDPDGKVVASKSYASEARQGETPVVEGEHEIPNPRRWDVDHPHLYTAVTLLRVDGQVVERRETPFGVRTFEFTADDGFHLNGRRVQLKGVNLHHGHGPLGAAFHTRAIERQLEIMQSMGANAIRTSHNTPAREVLDLCDRMGILVWDELFDKWGGTAGRVEGEPPFEPYVAKHAREFVRRDRNHPSVVVWSIGNEILNQPHEKEGKSPERVAFARQEFLRHDSTRPVGLGCFIPSTAETKILDSLDLTGWNYARRYTRYRERYPDKPIVYSESASALSTRGWYHLPLATDKCDYAHDEHQVSAFELNAAGWSDLAEVEFDLMKNDPYVAGEFVWTGFDYLGEPTPFSQEARSSYFGAVDLVGLPKDRYYLYRSHWRPEAKTIHIAPHWNWSGHEGPAGQKGKGVPVMVYTNGDEGELFVNGRSQGVRRKGERPPQPANVAVRATATASSHADGKPAQQALATEGGGWAVAEDDQNPWFAVDLGEERKLATIGLVFPRQSKLYGYTVEASDDGNTWREIGRHTETREPMWGGVPEAFLSVDGEGRHVRLVFGKCLERAKPAIKSFAVYESPKENDYYAPTYDYRLRWNNVRYEPGEIKVVVKKDGEPLGETTVRTAGEPARLRLTPDRTELAADGEDLCYLTVEALDTQGVPCPTADARVRLELEGPCEVAGVGNGNPLSLEPFQSDELVLFSGKAVAIVRTQSGAGGSLKVTAASDGLQPATAELTSSR